MAKSISAKLAAAKAALNKKQADLDAIDDQIMGLDSAIPMDAPATPEFDLLTAKREELEEEIRTMREGVQFISEWEKLKGGQWSEGIKSQLDGLDSEIANIAGGEAAAPDMGAPMGDPLAAPPAPDALSAPEAPAAPAADIAPEAAPAPEVAAPEAPAPALEPPMASAKSPISKKNNYQVPLKKGNSAPSEAKEGSKMANETATKPSLKEKLAELKAKRANIKKEAQIRTAAAYTIANTMLPGAPVEKRQAFASSLLQGNDTKSLVAALRQTAINAHYTKVAEQFKEVHKVEMNDLLEDPSVLKAERSAVEKEIKGDAKSAAVSSKTADDRKDAGPQTETYNDGRGCGGGTHTEPKEMEAGKAGDRPDAGEKPGQTVDLSSGKSASKKCDKDCKGCAECKKEASADKKAAEKCADCKDGAKCAAHKAAAAAAPKKAVDQKIAEPVMDAPVEEAPAAPAGDELALDAPAEEAPEGDLGIEAPPADDAGAILTDEKKMVVEEKIEEAQEAIKALEQEILEENEEEPALALEEGEPSEEELDLSSVFDQGEMEDKAAALANEGEEHMAAEDYFAPTSAAGMESVLDDSGMQVASIEDYFSMQGADADPLYSLIASENKTAEQVEGFDVLESFTGEVANKLKQHEAGPESRDNEADHEEDLFAEAMKDIKPEPQGAKRTPQDCVPELQAPKSASAKTAAKADPKGSIKRVRPVVASPKPVDIATALFGDDE